MKKIFISFLFILLITSIKAIEIKSVTRDYYFANIFTHKSKLVGESHVNKFDFGETSNDENSSEIFIVKLRSKKFERGQPVSVVFEYKLKNSKKLMKKQQEILLDKQTLNVKFFFSKALNKKLGRVELWTVKILKKGHVIVSKKSAHNKWKT